MQRRIEDALADQPMDCSITAKEEEKLFAISTEGQDLPTIEEFDVDVLMSAAAHHSRRRLLSAVLLQIVISHQQRPVASPAALLPRKLLLESQQAQVRFQKEESGKKTSKGKTASERKSSPKLNQARTPQRTKRGLCLPVGPEEIINRE